MLLTSLLMISGIFLIWNSNHKIMHTKWLLLVENKLKIQQLIRDFSYYIGLIFICSALFSFFKEGFVVLLPAGLLLISGFRFSLNLLNYVQLPNDVSKMESIKYMIVNFYDQRAFTLGIINLIFSLMYIYI